MNTTDADKALQFCESWFDTGMRASWGPKMFNELAAVLAAIRSDERERCAKIADEYARRDNPNAVTISMMIAKAIREAQR